MLKLHYLFLLLAVAACAGCAEPAPSRSPRLDTADGRPARMRGVWLTNVASDALNSRENIEAAVALCDSLGFTHIFVVTWNDATTTFPSRTVERVTGVAIQPEFAGRDPLAELISAAHSRNIEVHAWFEFGFSCSYQKSDGGPIIAARPHWAARDKQGQIATKNGFQWMNAFHPEVQQFMTDLVLEVVQNYDIDGIQGDDRLPALPSLAGYDDYTKGLYREAHSGQDPPQNEKDYNWVKWRSARLNDFLFGLVQQVRAVKPDITISLAPSIYPWSEEEYLQDWPTWIHMGWIDWVIPQVYRYRIDRYTYELEQLATRQVAPDKQPLLFPGVLLQVDQYSPTEGMLDSMIQANRHYGFQGEVFFFYEGLKKHRAYFLKNKQQESD